MTNDEQLAKAYPEHIARLRELCSPKFLAEEVEHGSDAATTMAYGFVWHETAEGWDYWHTLYRQGQSDQSRARKNSDG